MSESGRKRKRESQHKQSRPKARRTSPSPEGPDIQTVILELETQVAESRKHYNNLANLLLLSKQPDSEANTAILASVSLCRAFSRLLSSGDMEKRKGMSETEVVVIQWLKDRYQEFLRVLLESLHSQNPAKQSTALTLLMRMAKEEAKTRKDYNWKDGSMYRIVEKLLLLPEDDPTKDEFAAKYLTQFDDIRFYTFQSIT